MPAIDAPGRNSGGVPQAVTTLATKEAHSGIGKPGRLADANRRVLRLRVPAMGPVGPAPPARSQETRRHETRAPVERDRDSAGR